jgi:hypothetical protein
VYQPYLRCDTTVWRDLTQRMAEAGVNQLVIDVGDGVKYASHPEISVRRAWSPARLRRELDRLRGLGIEPIPKLNFATTHDAWLGPYARCVSTDTYYGVCRDVIAEVAALFDRPRFFHLGMDEETAQHQRFHRYAVIRQFDLWWHDLYFYIDEVEKAGSRAWVWSDYVWHNPQAFFRKMPKSVLQSNWYYGKSFSRKLGYVQAYLDLARRGYDQVPTGSNWTFPENFGRTVSFCRKHIPAKRLLGFMTAPWYPTLPACHQAHVDAIDLLARARMKIARQSER